ncbi:efflux RND transporter permease subunit [Candidatus Protochlamydia phocaeensis]|uniref:efflux RND transporter permease subunit n=1 Tax=Candidatus Protochlamydia phocaeensis TaxID=1414722 RepID=UPI0008392637|nr:efflux RND transporter permease subunit [Candidatus Protochlamydia phocaeensis]
MNLSQPFILRPVMTTLLTAAILILGLYAYFSLPVSNLPDVNYPTITVSVPFPGANPEIMANTVATPLEKEFMTIPGIKYVTSSNTLGSTSIILEFDINKDIDLAAVDVDAAIVRARPNLPPNLPQEPTYKKVNPSATPILYLVVTSPTVTRGELYDYANTLIGQRISILEGVSEVLVYGTPKAVRAQVDPGVIASLGLTMPDISANISSGNQYQPLGQFDGTHVASTIYDTGALYTANEYRPLIIAYKNGSPVRVENLGMVLDSLRDDRSERHYIDHRINQPSVTLAVQRQPGANTVTVANAVKKLLATLKTQLPGSLELIILFDRSESIRESIKDVQFTLVLAFILVVFVIFIYLGKFRDTLIPALVMPLSIIATFAVIYQLGYTLDNLSLLALTLAIGFIIDDAIVVLENIVRWIEKGNSPLDASLEGSKQISFTIVSMTLSLVAVFIPLIFMAGLIGKLFQEFSITLTVVTLISGLISLTLTPMLCSRFLPPRTELHRGKIAFLSEQLNAWMLRHYERGLKWTLEHRGMMLLIGIGSVILSAFLFKILPTDFIPDEDIGFLIAYTESEQGTSSEQMNAYQQQVIRLLRQEPFIESLMSISASPVYRQGLIFIRLIPRNQRSPVGQIIQQLNKKLNSIPGVNVYLKNIPLIDLSIGSQARAAYQYLMQSLDQDELYRGADALLQKMRQDPLFQGVSTDLEIKTPQQTLVIDRDQASALGIDAANFEQTLSLGFSGNRISRIQTPLDQYDVILELDRNFQRNPSSLNFIYLRSSTTNQLVPLKAVASLKESVGPASINHFAQFPAVTISFNLAPNIPLSQGLQHLREMAAATFSDKVTGDVKGTAETFEESIRSVGFLIIITILSIYIILGILYESFIHPLTILSTLPPAIVGALLTLFFTGQPLSLYAYLGIILLIGIVKKNGIMIVDFALDNIRQKGESAEKSIFDASLVRFRPIMMTTIAAIMGAIPIAMGIGAGADSRRPLGYVIIGGMLISQLITLFLTPVIYLYLEQLREKFSSK